ncbi:hypothetical protein Tco_0980970 [Tanacetum coccineum]
MKEGKAYKTYLGFATGAVPPKAARKFKKASPSKKGNVPILEGEEPVKKGKRLKTTTKKSAYKPATALTEEAQIKEVQKKSLKDFHKTHLSGSGTVAEDTPSVSKITPPITSKGTGDIPGVPDVTKDDSSESESESWGNNKDDSNEEHVSSDEGSEGENESDKQASDLEQEEESEADDQEENKDDDDLELESNDETEGDEEIDDTTDQFDDADARLEEPTETATGIAPTLLSIPVSVIPKSSPVFTNFPQSSHTFTPTPIQATPTPLPTIETSNPLANLPDFSSVFRFNNRISALEKEVVGL